MNKPTTHQTPDSTRLDPFEQQLARALRRVDVRADTARKFLALAAEAEQTRAAQGSGPRLVKLSNGGRVLAFPRLGPHARAWGTGALAAGLLLSATLGGVHLEHRQQQVRAEREFQAAERIENRTLQQIRQQVEQAGIPLD